MVVKSTYFAWLRSDDGCTFAIRWRVWFLRNTLSQQTTDWALVVSSRSRIVGSLEVIRHLILRSSWLIRNRGTFWYSEGRSALLCFREGLKSLLVTNCQQTRVLSRTRCQWELWSWQSTRSSFQLRSSSRNATFYNNCCRDIILMFPNYLHLFSYGWCCNTKKLLHNVCFELWDISRWWNFSESNRIDRVPALETKLKPDNISDGPSDALDCLAVNILDLLVRWGKVRSAVTHVKVAWGRNWNWFYH